ncbi:Uncharacterised protein [Mycobacteroides abscessus subsp. abscessus]|jgi:hypothetical protein|nr:Uncharacterised protein [Mycobacteroides abscessus subsp. abscessus]SKL81739.1 Uncharacterised protein [Mycobacteroides abscessus subsp. abscessus]SKM51838.1 Uncharacterised protein [Mycobacteroides abscessus subsp. abscessus]SLK34282.1 Uncharacterised protein [Mycobacteroides abscessus subsp. abscessus]
MVGCVHGPAGDCGRKAVVRDMCMTHYRRWRRGESLDTPVRGYSRFAEGPDGACIPAPEVIPAKKPGPFARERELLRELGLG